MLQGLGFYIGSFFIAWYGLSIVTGLTAASLTGWYQIRTYEKDFNDFVILAAVGGLCGIIGAKLLYLVVSFHQIDFSRLSDPDYFTSLMSGGFVFYGGLIGGLAGLYVCHRFFRIDVYEYFQITVPCLPVAHAFGRIGCSLVGCCYGGSYHGIGAVTYRHSFFAPNNIPLFPVQHAEAAGNIIIAAILLFYINRMSGKRALQLYLLLYAVLRFLLEFFRSDAERGVLAGLSASQYISICIVSALVIHKYITAKKRPDFSP